MGKDARKIRKRSDIEMPLQRAIYRVSKKHARFSKLKNIPNLLSDDKERKIIQNIDFSYFSNRVSFMENHVSATARASKYKLL